MFRRGIGDLLARPVVHHEAFTVAPDEMDSLKAQIDQPRAVGGAAGAGGVHGERAVGEALEAREALGVACGAVVELGTDRIDVGADRAGSLVGKDHFRGVPFALGRADHRFVNLHDRVEEEAVEALLFVGARPDFVTLVGVTERALRGQRGADFRHVRGAQDGAASDNCEFRCVGGDFLDESNGGITIRPLGHFEEG